MTTLENDKLKVQISEHGAELISVLDKCKEQEDLWQADPAVWGRHAPILFPFVGKVNGGEYRYKGKSYSMGQHGFARDMDFKLLSSDDTHAVYQLTETAETLEKYPFAFVLRVSYELTENTIRVGWSVENPSNEDMYFSIGGHPAFRAAPGYYVTFEGAKVKTYYLLDPKTGCVDTEHEQRLDMPDGFLELSTGLFDHDALIFDGAQISRATLCTPDRKPFVTIDCAGFPSFGLWCQTGAPVPFVCLEPWIGRADNKDFHGELSEKYEEQKLAPGARFTVDYQLSFE